MSPHDAHKFAFGSFITAFAPGNEHMLDQFFDPELIMLNHSVGKQFNLDTLKAQLPKIHSKYQDIKSEILNLFQDGDRIAFHVRQEAFSLKSNKLLSIDVMNLYQLSKGKVKEWQIWENFKQAEIDSLSS